MKSREAKPFYAITCKGRLCPSCHQRHPLTILFHTATATLQSFLRCGDLAVGFTPLQCPN